MALAIPRLRREHGLTTRDAALVLSRWAEQYEARYHQPALFGRGVHRPRTANTWAAHRGAALRRAVVPILRATPDIAASVKATVLRYSSRVF